jgi:hypothetical protein
MFQQIILSYKLLSPTGQQLILHVCFLPHQLVKNLSYMLCSLPAGKELILPYMPCSSPVGQVVISYAL